MFEVDVVNDVVILSPDVVRMTIEREQAIQGVIVSEVGIACKAFGIPNEDGWTTVELWGGDETERATFKEELTKRVLN